MTINIKETRQRAAAALKSAKSKWGAGWAHLSAEQRQGAVALEVVVILTGQDLESASAPLIRLIALADEALRLAAPEQYQEGSIRRLAACYKSEEDVHTGHCCRNHGCKYGKRDCPVVSGAKAQQYPCEDCDRSDL